MSANNEQFLLMALAYIEIGRVAASADTALKHDCAYKNAVTYQLFHAMELFYKYMIKNKSGSFEHTHDLRRLEEKYHELYPNDDQKIIHPFDFLNYNACELNENEKEFTDNHLVKFRPKYLDQHLRYPSDERTGGYSFSLEPSVFEDLKGQMLRASASNC